MSKTTSVPRNTITMKPRSFTQSIFLVISSILVPFISDKVIGRILRNCQRVDNQSQPEHNDVSNQKRCADFVLTQWSEAATVNFIVIRNIRYYCSDKNN